MSGAPTKPEDSHDPYSLHVKNVKREMSYSDVLDWLNLPEGDPAPKPFQAFTLYDRWIGSFDVGEPLALDPREARRLKSSGHIGLYYATLRPSLPTVEPWAS